MPRWRVWMVFALAAVLLGGHLFDIIRQREHWPFSFYPMYGRVQKKRLLRMPALYGVMQDGKREKGQRITRSYVPQLSEARIRNILIAAWDRNDIPKSKRKVAAGGTRRNTWRRIGRRYPGPSTSGWTSSASISGS